MKTTLLFCVMLMAIDPSAYAEDKNTIEYLESRITENEKLMKQTFDVSNNYIMILATSNTIFLKKYIF